jgi:hypothetical protein
MFTPIKNFLYTIPRFKIGKTHKDMRMARLIDLNEVSNSIPTSTEQYTEVDISAADIDGASSYVVKELLPSLEDTGKYYAFKEVLVEFHKGTVAFTPEGGRMYFTDGDNSYQIGDWGMGFLASLDDKVCEIPVGAQEYPDAAAPTARFTPMSDLDWRYIYIYIAQASFTNSSGDGTMKVKMTYTIETFG